MSARLSGVTIPLFSLRSRSDWGIGQITDLPAAAAFFLRAGQKLLQVLPTHELAEGETSPYGALSAFALDPIFIDVESVPDADVQLGRQVLGDDGVNALMHVRAAKSVDYGVVRTLKRKVLAAAAARFREAAQGERTKAFDAFVERERSWLHDHALYAAIRRAHDGYGWTTWPANERDRAPEVLAAAIAPKEHGDLGARVLEEMYLQWIAHEQWFAARKKLHELGVVLMGDMPFIIGSESSDIWAHREQFRTDVSLGAPPDDFSADGQSWGLPAYDWSAMDKDGLAWLRARAKHEAELFDRFRIDHVIGFFRQWLTPPGEKGAFDPTEEPAQQARGEKVLRAMIEAAGPGTVIAENLGVIPDWAREIMARLELPGYKVLPWERDEDFIPRDVKAFPELSVSTWSTHDTWPITEWWYRLEDWERERIAKQADVPLDTPEKDRELALVRLLFSSRSNLTLLLAQEVLGDKTRINLPGHVGPENWTWRLDRPLEELAADPAVNARLAAIKTLAQGSGRF
ncbi:MAG: 4-alpha-glucanotransferase [Labilithrix sp.]|nr:4-alpha-glucanotransferase [Labilithrix sp.]MCW5816090.1 4-alpha-glucanotransferase [Labilithrix sp.]